jgi:ATP-binding cassette subfamily B protein
MSAEEGSAFDVYRQRVERPLYRLFTEYAPGRLQWLTIGMVGNVIARIASLLPPLVLGVAIDSVLTGDQPYTLPLVPNSWMPVTDAEQFWFSAWIIVGSFVTTSAFTYIYGVAANNFAHRVMHTVRTDSFETM